MNRRNLAGFIFGLLVFGTYGVANADSVTLLEDFRVTNNINHVAHLGDQVLSEFLVPAAQGHTITFEFDVSTELIATDVSLTITHYQANLNLGYYNHIFVNGVDLGYLSFSPEHWFTDQLQFSGAILDLTGNILTINSYKLGTNYDDFEFTNLKLATAVTADAGPSQIICNEICDRVILDGRNSFDINGEIVSYEWELLHREDSNFDMILRGETPIVSNLEPGIYDVRLTVENSAGLADSDEMVLTVQETCDPCLILKGDFDSDGDVDGDDLNIFVQHYGTFPLTP